MLLKFKKLTLSLCILGMSSLSAAQLTFVEQQKQIEEYTLDNGLRIILAPNDKESKVYLNMVYFTGSLDDPQGKGGLAHLLEHLLFKGTENIKDDEFQRRLDQHSLMNNAMTGFHFTSYINVVPAQQKNINEILLLEAERMDKSIIKMEHVPNEIEIVKREREIRLDQPFSVVQDQIFKELYGNQSLGREPIGDLEELKSIRLNELQQFYKTWYKPNNAALIITGKFNKADTLKMIEQQFQHIQPAASFPDRASQHIPAFNFNNLKNRQFNVKKGSHFATYVGYLGGENLDIQNRLSVADTLFTMEPNGRLYQQLVKNKKAIDVGGTSLNEKYYNFVLLGANYAPQHQRDEIEQILQQQIEQGGEITEEEVNRVRLATRNISQSLENDAVAFGSVLTQYIVSAEKGWQGYFADIAELEKLQAKDVNSAYSQFFKEQNRIVINIEPTPEDQKQAQQKQNTLNPLKSTQTTETAEPLKDVKEYQQEQHLYLAESKQYIDQLKPKLQQGRFKNGLQYTFYTTPLRDDKVYATITLGVSTHAELKNKVTLLSMMSSQLVRGSTSHNLQQVLDKSLELNGSVKSSVKGNRISINISADKKYFDEYFAFVIDLLQQPAFDEEDFQINKSAALASLDRSYTEPDIVANLTMDRATEIYPEGDFLYHFEPELAKKDLEHLDNKQLKQFYQDYFAMNHAQITITGEFDPKKTKKLLKNRLATWSTSQPYQRVKSLYYPYQAQKIHVLAEQREFGSYQAYMTFPVGIDHPDGTTLLVLSHILGGSQLSSRLAQELREKNNLVYGFDHSFNLSAFYDEGSWSLSANYKPELAQHVSQAVHKTIQDLKDKGVTEQEVEAAKTHLLKGRVSAIKDNRQVHGMIVRQMDTGRDMNERIQRDQKIAQVTKADVDRAIQRYLNQDGLVEVIADQYGHKVEFKPVTH